ncbi:MAG: SRPBCC family protein [Acidimicrobiales bacterium]
MSSGLDHGIPSPGTAAPTGDADGVIEPPDAFVLSTTVPGSLPEVWPALSTAAGLQSWCVPTVIDGRVGGRVDYDFGGPIGSMGAIIQRWEPEVGWASVTNGNASVRQEWDLEPGARPGETVVRLAVSGFGPDDTDHRLTAERCARVFLIGLRRHLARFRDQDAVAGVAWLELNGSRADVWSTLCEAAELPPAAAVGESVDTGAEAPTMAGTVSEVIDEPDLRLYVLDLIDPAVGTGFVVALDAGGDRVAAGVGLYLYDDPTGVDAAEPVGHRWQTWLRRRFIPVDERIDDDEPIA